MQLVGIVAKKKDIQAIRKSINENKDKENPQSKNIEIIEITRENIKNLRNIKFEEIIISEDIELNSNQYKFIEELISKGRFLILNGDIKINILEKIQIENPITIITYGFNSKTTLTISSVRNERAIICLQRNVEKANGEIIEKQEKEIKLKKDNKKIYNNLVVFIIKELHNL